MAAYAALVSLMRIIDKLHLHPTPPISLHKIQVESLTEKISFLLEFLEAYNPHLGYSTEADSFETLIADAAYAAEDLIESHIVDRITIDCPEKISSNVLYRGLEKVKREIQKAAMDIIVYRGLAKVIQDMASIQKEAMVIRELMELQHTKSTPPDSYRSSSIVHNSSMVGVDDVLLQMKAKLTSDSRNLQIIPIVGMGGTGKTTLASNIYQDALIQEHFHICAWATISQEYSIREIFTQVLPQLDKDVSEKASENELGDMLHKYLFGRKYLIIMDDMWNIEAWQKVRRFFPNNENGSRVVITTRLSILASELPGSNRFEMRLLDEDGSWDLLSKTVFGENSCPFELEEIGKNIAISCKGLPLSIVVVGGVLAKSKHTREYWEDIEENLNSIVNSVEDESCLRILHMSYKQLPVYLKPCFLYMGVFREDEVINVSRLTRLWVAEGFLKPIKGKSWEEIAKQYLKDLIDRNLILIHKLGKTGSIKKFKIHDLLRELCMREAEKEGFYVVARNHGVALITQRRIVCFKKSRRVNKDALQFVSLARSFIWDRHGHPPPLNFRLLRIFQSSWETKLQNMFELVNLRYLGSIYTEDDVKSSLGSMEKLMSSMNRLWNLETLIYRRNHSTILPADIWCMPQIRHVVGHYARIRYPPSGCQNDIVLGSLQTLVGIMEFQCSEEVVKRIPNLKKLGMKNWILDGRSCLNNLVCLHKLVSLDCSLCSKMPPSGPDSVHNLDFPQSLKKLKLGVDYSECWEDILKKIGTLPLLEKLTLSEGRFEEGKWETAEAQFRSLKYLKLFDCDNLKQWTVESSHFPRLEHLVLSGLKELEEIPLEVAEIPTLGSIKLRHCSESVVISARRIVEEQEETNGEAVIQVRVIIPQKNEAVESLASRNIRVQIRRY